MIPIKIESAWQGVSDCQRCGIREVALFANLTENDFGLIHAPIDDLIFPAGDTIFRETGKAHGIFTVREGMVKLVRVSHDGRERIVRVLRQGDVAGLEALVTSTYDTDAVALTEVKLCRIPLGVIQSMAAATPKIHIALMHKWQKTLRDADDWLADLNFGTASQRVLRFVMKMRDPNQPDTTTLFPREDMGSMLGLTLETVSREVSKLVKSGVLTPTDKQGRVYRVQHLPE